MRNRYFIIGIAFVLVLGLFIALAYILVPFYKEDVYREALEAGFSAALERRVTLEGPISLVFSLHPRLILENVHVSNPPWASQAHFFQAARLEITVSLGPLLQRHLEIEEIVLDEANLFLEEGPDGLDNWTIGKDEVPGIWSHAVPHITMKAPESGEVAIKDSRISYRSYPPESFHEVTIEKASSVSMNEHLRKISVVGTFQDVPLNVEFNGGRLADLLDLTKAWPIDGVISAHGASAVVKGNIGGPDPDQIFDLEVQLKGDRLSALNDLLKIDLPESAPFMVAANVNLNNHVISLNNARATLGTSDITGQLIMSNKEGRQLFMGQLTAETLQLNDFIFPAKESLSEQTVPSKPSSTALPALLPFDADLDITVNRWLGGETELGSVSLSVAVREKQVDISPARINSFGGTVNARLQVQLTTPQPQSTFEATVTSLNYGHALRALGVVENIDGSTDFHVTASGSGATWQEFLRSWTVKFQTARTTFGFPSPIPEARLPLVLHQGSLRVLNGGPVTIVANGAYQGQAFGLRLLTASPVDLATPETSRPVSLTAQAGGALLEIKGTLNTDKPDLQGALSVSLKGRRLSELDSGLPPVGPFMLKAYVTKEGNRYTVSDLRSRFGGSDLSGKLEVNLQKVRPHLTGVFTSQKINVDEFSQPGDSAIPTETLHAFDADMNMSVDQMQNGALEIAGLALTAGLQDGRLMVKALQGTLLDSQFVYGNFQGGFTLDTAGKIPTLSGGVVFNHLRYDQLFPGVRFVDLTENVINLDAKFSSRGTTIFSMLNRSTVIVEGEKLQVRFQGESDSPAPVRIISNLKVESMNGGPLHLQADGIFQNTSFRLRSSTAPIGRLLNGSNLWPLDVALDVPHALARLRGHLHLLQPAEDFTFNIFVQAENLRDWQFLSTNSLPDVGPIDMKGLLTRTPMGFHLTNMDGVLGESHLQGDVTLMTQGVRPRVTGNFTAETIVLGTLKEPPVDSSAQKKRSTLRAMADSVKGIGSMAMDTLTDTLGVKEKPAVSKSKTIPEFAFPVDALRSFDLLLDGKIKQVRKEKEDLGHVSFQMTLEEGLLTMEPVSGNLWGGAFDGKVVLDGTQYVPTLDVGLNIRGLDYGRVTRTFGGTDLVRGQSQSIMLALKGRGDTIAEVLERANGKFELIDGPLELATKYLDLWAADLITTALTTAWKQESVTKLNCTVGYFDIEQGVLKSDHILMDTSRLTIAGLGKLNLADETIDALLTPRPKDPSLLNLAHTVRITGPLSEPDVSNDKFRIAESGGWSLLGLVNPLGWVIAIPHLAGTTMGTLNQNPCVEALKGRQQTAQALDEIKGGLWGKIKRAFTNLAGFSNAPSDNPQ